MQTIKDYYVQSSLIFNRAEIVYTGNYWRSYSKQIGMKQWEKNHFVNVCHKSQFTVICDYSDCVNNNKINKILLKIRKCTKILTLTPLSKTSCQTI